jgi:hypothetical protein
MSLPSRIDMTASCACGSVELAAPPLQMRICTKYKAPDVVLSDDVPSYPGYPLRFLAKLLASGVAMLLRR